MLSHRVRHKAGGTWWLEIGAMFKLVAQCRAVVTGSFTSTVELLVAMTVVIHQFALGLRQPVR